MGGGGEEVERKVFFEVELQQIGQSPPLLGH